MGDFVSRRGVRVWLGGLLIATSAVGIGYALPTTARHQTAEPLEPNECVCRVNLNLSKPQLTFNREGVLVFQPRVDVQVTSKPARRGSLSASNWTLTLAHEGTATFLSTDIAVPPTQSFAGTQTAFASFCGARFRHTGLPLPPVPLAPVTRGLLADGDEITGTVRLAASVSGCGTDAIDRQFRWLLREFGRELRINGWRSVGE